MMEISFIPIAGMIEFKSYRAEGQKNGLSLLSESHFLHITKLYNNNLLIIFSHHHY